MSSRHLVVEYMGQWGGLKPEAGRKIILIWNSQQPLANRRDIWCIWNGPRSSVISRCWLWSPPSTHLIRASTL